MLLAEVGNDLGRIVAMSLAGGSGSFRSVRRLSWDGGFWVGEYNVTRIVFLLFVFALALMGLGAIPPGWDVVVGVAFVGFVMVLLVNSLVGDSVRGWLKARKRMKRMRKRALGWELEDQLKELREKRDRGIITSREYRQVRKRLRKESRERKKLV